MTSKKNPSNVHVYSRFTAIPFAVGDFNFHLIIVAKLKHSKHFCKFKRRLRAMLIQAETT